MSFVKMPHNVLFTQLNPTFVNAAFITCVNTFSISFKLNVYKHVYECFTKLFLINIKLVYECLQLVSDKLSVYCVE